MAKTAMDLVQAARAGIREVSVSQAQQMIEDGSKVLDVREPAEFNAGHIDGATHIPRGVLEFSIADHADFQDKTSPIVVYCKSGGRAALWAEMPAPSSHTRRHTSSPSMRAPSAARAEAPAC